MALPRPVIQSRLPGLLALLGIQNTGVNPPDIGGTVQPTVDLHDWYLRGQEEWINQPSTLILPTGAQNGITNNFFTVPVNEVWYVRHFTVNVITGAADTVTPYAPAVQFPLAYHTLAPARSVVANSFDTSAASLPFWAPGGATLSIYCGRNAVAAALSFCGASATITRMKVG